MKLLPYILCIACLTVACTEKKQSDNIITRRTVAPKPKAPVKMQDYHQATTVSWQGQTYAIDITRSASDSLAIQKGDNGQKYIDNAVSLTIKRGGGMWLNRHFTKAAFCAHVPDAFAEKGILEGFVFDKADGPVLRFAASVCLPGTDEYYPLSVSFDKTGAMKVEAMQEEM